MIDTIKRTVAGGCILTVLIAMLMIAFKLGQMQMHTRLTDDMQRYNEAPISAVTHHGCQYMYSYDMPFIEWDIVQRHKHEDK